MFLVIVKLIILIMNIYLLYNNIVYNNKSKILKNIFKNNFQFLFGFLLILMKINKNLIYWKFDLKIMFILMINVKIENIKWMNEKIVNQ